MELCADGWHKHSGLIAHFKSLLINGGELRAYLELLLNEVGDLFIGYFCVHITIIFSPGLLTLFSYRVVTRAKYIFTRNNLCSDMS